LRATASASMGGKRIANDECEMRNANSALWSVIIALTLPGLRFLIRHSTFSIQHSEGVWRV
jgi:hypothetical protein